MWRRGWIWKRTLKKGQTYCLRWHDESGRIRTETVGPDRRLAERLRTRREEDLNSGRLRGIRKVAYEAFQNEELEAMKGRLAESSLESLERTLVGFGEVCKVKWLVDVTPTMVEGFFSERIRCGSLATANKYLRTLKASLNRAVRRGYLERNPASDVKQVREPEKELRVLTPGGSRQTPVGVPVRSLEGPGRPSRDHRHEAERDAGPAVGRRRRRDGHRLGPQ
jgi:hypothetical protein